MWISAQFGQAIRRLGLLPNGRLVRGVADRTLSGRVTDPATGAARWLRVLALPTDKARGLLWDGPLTAPTDPGIRRPDLLTTERWTTDGHTVRAELWELVDEPPCSPHEALTPEQARSLSLTGSWWAALETSLERLADHATDRVPRTQEQITAAMRHAYGPDIDTRVDQWITQHGDLRWTNLTARTPYLLDWEFWGLAPTGTDAATLYCTSLLAPDVAATVYQRYRHILDTPDGRLAQLCVCIQLRRHPDVGALDQPLRRLAHQLARQAGEVQ
ncbi:hypothetical protein ABZ801_17995 [Actinomadura sp. NPDC047616]|uniref:hypothetical protein n=1 Tax=Actinomadura sp. NPDC047616 TaxID=3155914 RepID=UPI0033CF1765